MRNEGLQKTLIAGAAIEPNRIVKFDAAADTVVKAAAATDKLIGVADNMGADAAGERIDIIMDGIALVSYGGNVAAGDMLTADANGRAIATTTASNRIVGIAMEAGVSGDIGSVLISQASV